MPHALVVPCLLVLAWLAHVPCVHAQDSAEAGKPPPANRTRRDNVDVGVQIPDAPLNADLQAALQALALRVNASGNGTSALVGVAGVTQRNDAFGVRLDTSATPAAACPPGFFALAPGSDECALCPWGFWCNASRAFACPMGTSNPDTGGASAAACARCAAGTYTSAPGAAACLACPAGAYCAGGDGAPRACPAHTTSAAGGASVLDCVCLPDYLCTYARRVTLQLALNTSLTLQALQSDPSLAATLREGVLLALGLYGVAGVSATLVNFVSLTN